MSLQKSNPPHNYTLYLYLLLQWTQQVYEYCFRFSLLCSMVATNCLHQKLSCRDCKCKTRMNFSTCNYTCGVFMHNLKNLCTAKSAIGGNFSALWWIYFGDFIIFAKDKVCFIWSNGERVYCLRCWSCDQ